MPLFTPSQISQINKAAEKSKATLNPPTQSKKAASIVTELAKAYALVQEYFKDSEAVCIKSMEQLHEYIDLAVQCGWVGIDTETTGLDRIHDTIVGWSLYYPGGYEVYIPCKHRVPIFEDLYKDQISYEESRIELQRLVDAKVKMILANADFDIAMIYKDIKVDIIPCVYFDVILAWRCIKEDEKDNALKILWAKYVMKGKVIGKKFSDFFNPKIFPYAKPEVAALYASNDAKITWELFTWQLPYVTIDNPKCKKHHLEDIAKLVWNVEMPMIKVCAMLHRTGFYIDTDTVSALSVSYHERETKEVEKLQNMIQEYINTLDKLTVMNSPFKSGKDFNFSSPVHVKYLLYKMMKIPFPESEGTGKEVLQLVNHPITDQILKARGVNKLINTYVDKLPTTIAKDGRIHGCFKSIGAACITGDSIIPTSHGYRTLEDICEAAGCKDAEHVEVSDLIIVNKDQQLESAASVIRYTDYPTIRITTECGFTIEGTYNHPVMVSSYRSSDNVTFGDKRLSVFWKDREFRNLEDIQVGDFIEIPCNYSVCPTDYVKTEFKTYPPYNSSKTVAKLPKVYDESFAEFLGIYHADGAANLREDTYTITVSNDNPDVISRVDELSTQLFNVATSHYTAQADRNEVETYVNCMQIRDIDNILSHGKQNKRIPDAIWKSPKSVINSYIKGMTLDSSVYMDQSGRAAFELSIINEHDARLVQYHLVSQGILCYRTFNINKDGWKTPRLSFNADNYILFRDTVGFVEREKYIETKQCAKNRYDSRRIENSFRVKVTKVEYSRNTVYDLHIPETHSFISNGFISHNTGRMSSEAPNMQNIPSHATDIRHMFRATPESFEKLDSTNVTDDEITFIVPRWYSVTINSAAVEASTVHEGDELSILDNNVSVAMKVTNVEEVDENIKITVNRNA